MLLVLLGLYKAIFSLALFTTAQFFVTKHHDL